MTYLIAMNIYMYYMYFCFCKHFYKLCNLKFIHTLTCICLLPDLYFYCKSNDVMFWFYLVNIKLEGNINVITDTIPSEFFFFASLLRARWKIFLNTSLTRSLNLYVKLALVHHCFCWEKNIKVTHGGFHPPLSLIMDTFRDLLRSHSPCHV